MIASKPTPEDPGLAFDLEPQRSVGAAGLGVANQCAEFIVAGPARALFMGVSLAMPPRTILGCGINHSHDVTTRQLPFVGRCAGLRSVNLIP